MERKLSRRRVLSIGAGTLAAAALSPLPASLAQPRHANRGSLLVRPDKRGTILFTQRDAVRRRSIWNNPEPTMGYLGGPNFPDDPDDLGPLVPLPGGFLEVFEYLAGVGFKQVEFASYRQHEDAPGGAVPSISQGGTVLRENFGAYLHYARTLRGFLDATGLEAIGNHGFIPDTWPGGPNGGMSADDYDRLQVELEFASILGMPYMGTGGDPTRSDDVEDWDLAAEKWEAMNELAHRWRISIYPHNHSDAYGFLEDGPMVEVTEDLTTGEPLPEPQTVRSSSGIRKMQYYLDITNRSTCYCEIDIFWAYVAQHQFQWYYDANGSRVHDVFDPLEQVARQTTRYPLYHAKDGERTDEPAGEGRGYEMVPFQDPRSDIDYRTFFRNQRARGYHNPNYEQDNAPGGGDDPGQSLRFSHISAVNMSNLRG